MAQFFQRNRKSKRPIPPKAGSGNFRSRFSPKAELVDPISYNGEIDQAKYPILPISNSTKKIEEEIENPLNRR